MKPMKRFYYRAYQTVFDLGSRVLPWRKPEIVSGAGSTAKIPELLRSCGVKKVMIVSGKHTGAVLVPPIRAQIEAAGISAVHFDGVRANPTISIIEQVRERYLAEGCDGFLAVGGGSPMDTAKAAAARIVRPNRTVEQMTGLFKVMHALPPFIAVPTTAGTGSEATRYAVIYFEGEKQSVSHESCIPSAVLMDPSALRTLPEYQKKATMLDALCHAVESFWSIHSDEQSKAYARAAISRILENKDAYLANEEAGNSEMLQAAHLAGKAINITQTTAGHAMCYKITSLYGIAHGHAAALCVKALWPYMLEHPDQCTDPRGAQYLQTVFCELARAFGCDTPDQAMRKFQMLVEQLSLPVPQASGQELALLASSVNPVRLKNHPVALDQATILALYQQILGRKTQ